ncbi:MAG: hypothetical protein DI570_15410 [Phenylobacterium zucineum]|nr:MAG: hypothetical protein DI570_15410 [Phenylobacterium zucineum]
MEVRGPLTPADRQALSAGVFLSLSDDAGRTDWPWREMEAAPPCPVSSFRVDGVAWEISGGEGAAPLRWARAQGSDVYYFLAQGPNLAEARAWAATRRNGAAAGRSATYLVGTDGGLQFVMKIYDGAPDARRLADDLAAAITGKLDPIAAFDPTGDAVTVGPETEDGLTAELFRPALVGAQRHATLLGPDGRFFAPVDGGVTLRGSELICGDAYGPFIQSRLTVLRTDDEALDLGCSFYSEESWISVFSTHKPDASSDKQTFRDDIRSTQSDTGMKGKAVATRTSAGDALRAGSVWVDKNQMGQGLWFIRRGEYVVEIRATFRVDETDAVYDLVASMLKNAPPTPRPDLRG